MRVHKNETFVDHIVVWLTSWLTSKLTPSMVTITLMGILKDGLFICFLTRTLDELTVLQKVFYFNHEIVYV